MDISKLPRLSQTPAQPTDDASAADAVAAVPPGSAWCGHCHAPNAPGARFCNTCGAELRPTSNDVLPVGPGVGAEVWLSAIVGVVLMFVGMTFARWAVTTLTGGTFHTNVNWTMGPNAGTEVGYWELQGFTALQDAALFLFGLAMVLEALVLLAVHSRLRAQRPLLLFALSITLFATSLNVLVAGKLVAAGLIPLMSLLAVGFGVYIAVYEWRLWLYLRGRAEA